MRGADSVFYPMLHSTLRRGATSKSCWLGQVARIYARSGEKRWWTFNVQNPTTGWHSEHCTRCRWGSVGSVLGQGASLQRCRLPG